MSAFPISKVRSELNAAVRLAIPVVFSYLGVMLLGTVDTMMLGRVSETALAAGALGNNVLLSLTIFPMSVLMCIEPLVAQAFGAGDEKAIARHLKQGMVLSVLFSMLVSIPMIDARGLLQLLRQPSEIVEGASVYLFYAIPANVAYFAFMVVRGALQSMSMMRAAVGAVILANLVNIVANYALVFGHWGFPALGVAGSAMATSISRWAMLVFLVVASMPALRRAWKNPIPGLFRPASYATALRVGIPIGFQRSLELWFFTCVAFLMGYLGSRELASHQVGIHLVALAYMVPLALGAAATTRVGNAVGRGDMPAARLSAAVALGLGGAVMGVFGLGFYLVPGLLTRLFTPDPKVIVAAAALVRIAAFFQVFDGVQTVASGVLRGAADTRVPAALALVAYWVLGLPLGVYLAFEAGWGPRGLWWGCTAGLAATSVFFLGRIRTRFRGEIAVVEGSRAASD